MRFADRGGTLVLWEMLDRLVAPALAATPAPAAQPAKPSAPLPDDANVVRGGSGESGGTKPGANSPEGIAAGTGTHPSGVTGFPSYSPWHSVTVLFSKSIRLICCLIDPVAPTAYARVFINSRTRSAIWSALVSSAKCPASRTTTFASGTSAR